MKITKVLDNLYKLEPMENMFLKAKESDDVYDGAIYLPKEEYKEFYEEISEEDKLLVEKRLEERDNK